MTPSLPVDKPISIDFFSKRYNKTTRLVNNVDQSSFIQGKHQWYEIELKQPVFAKSISIYVSGYDSWNEIDIEVDNSIELIKKKQKITNSTAIFEINRFIYKFKFKPDAKYTMLTSQSIEKLEVIGYTLDEFSEYETHLTNYLENVDKLNAEQEAFKNREEEINQNISSLREQESHAKTELTNIQSNIGQRKSELDSIIMKYRLRERN